MHHFEKSSNMATNLTKNEKSLVQLALNPFSADSGYPKIQFQVPDQSLLYCLVVGPSARSIVLKVINFMKRSIISPVKLDDLPH